MIYKTGSVREEACFAGILMNGESLGTLEPHLSLCLSFAVSSFLTVGKLFNLPVPCFLICEIQRIMDFPSGFEEG